MKNCHSSVMRFDVRGLGAWGPGFEDWSGLQECLQDGGPPSAEVTTASPAPESIPARERRRSPLAVKLAVEVATQACAQAGLNAADLPCVFASGMGDTQITDYMCRALLGESKLLSPTKFHNSVHNASAGYWTISTGCREASNAISAFDMTFPVALLEAAVQAMADEVPVLLVLHDIKVPLPMRDILPVSDSFAAALLLDPAGEGLEIDVTAAAAPWPELGSPGLEALYASNPAARSLALLALLATDSASLTLPLSSQRSLRVDWNRG